MQVWVVWETHQVDLIQPGVAHKEELPAESHIGMQISIIFIISSSLDYFFSRAFKCQAASCRSAIQYYQFTICCLVTYSYYHPPVFVQINYATMLCSHCFLTYLQRNTTVPRVFSLAWEGNTFSPLRSQVATLRARQIEASLTPQCFSCWCTRQPLASVWDTVMVSNNFPQFASMWLLMSTSTHPSGSTPATINSNVHEMFSRCDPETLTHVFCSLSNEVSTVLKT